MSYDVMIFDPTYVNTPTHADFMDWYNKATQWSESTNYPIETRSSAITACYNDLRADFPDIDDDSAWDDEDAEEPTTEYALGKDFLYISFAWSEAEEGHKHSLATAHTHSLAFADISNDTTIHFPDGRTLRP